jgi:hypothetical protein
METLKMLVWAGLDAVESNSSAQTFGNSRQVQVLELQLGQNRGQIFDLSHEMIFFRSCADRTCRQTLASRGTAHRSLRVCADEEVLTSEDDLRSGRNGNTLTQTYLGLRASP